MTLKDIIHLFVNLLQNIFLKRALPAGQSQRFQG